MDVFKCNIKHLGNLIIKTFATIGGNTDVNKDSPYSETRLTSILTRKTQLRLILSVINVYCDQFYEIEQKFRLETFNNSEKAQSSATNIKRSSYEVINTVAWS